MFVPPSPPLFLRARLDHHPCHEANLVSLSTGSLSSEGFRRFLPEDFGEGSGLFGHIDGDRGMVKLSVSDPVLGTRIMGEEFRDRMMDLAKRGRCESTLLFLSSFEPRRLKLSRVSTLPAFRCRRGCASNPGEHEARRCLG